MPRSIRFAVALALAALALPAAAQTTGALAGTVTDDAGQPLLGVAVLVEGTSRGAATDADGAYRVLNVPAGTHDVRVSFIGYGTKLIEGVQITVDKTTFLDVELAEAVIEGGDVVVQAFRVPPVETDRTFKRQVISEEELEALPVNTITDLVTMQAGVVRDIQTVPTTSQPLFGEYSTTPSDGFHFRGGRDGEAVYYFDGINVTDNLWGGFNIDQVGELSLNALEIQTGTFGPQYGEGMSAVVQMTTPDVVPDGFRLRAKGTTDALFPGDVSDGLASGEAQVTVPLGSRVGFVGSARGYSTDGQLYGFIYPDYVDTDGTDLTGDPVEVPMQYQDERTVSGKLIAQPTAALKLTAGGFLTDTQRGVYNHFFKYNPFGTPRVLLDSRLGYVRLNHAVGTKTYYDVTVGRYERGFRSRVFDTPELYAILPQRATGEFSITGEDFVFFDSAFDRNLVQANVTTQLGSHQLRVGTAGEWLAVSMERYNPDPSTGDDGALQFGIRESYDFSPRKYSAFASDKIEVVDIGMVLNIGLRLDVVDPNRPYPVDITDPFGETGDQPARAYVSPRLGVSFPIGEQAAFRFGYGTYRQFPDFFQLYQGANETYDRYPSPNVLVVPGALASSDIEEETTTNYETGVQVKLGPATSFDATAFYRESANLIGVQIVEATGEAAGARYPVFSNLDFATARGIELTLRQQGEVVSGFVNYTYSRAYVTSSVLFQQATDLTRTFPAAWDRPHVLSTGLFVRAPGEWGGSAFVSLSSGTPYTFTRFDPNAERAPFILTNDLQVSKGFSVGGATARGFVQVRNVLGRRNVWWVYADSGVAGVDANPATSDDYTDNPAMWGPGRRLQIGLQLDLDGLPF